MSVCLKKVASVFYALCTMAKSFTKPLFNASFLRKMFKINIYFENHLGNTVTKITKCAEWDFGGVHTIPGVHLHR